jgi:hypothetical protein
VRFLQGVLAWFGVGLFGLWLTLRLLSVRGQPWLLPRVMMPLEWLLVVAGLGLLAFQLYRLWRRRFGPRPVTDETRVPFVRFWHGWRETRVPEDSIRLEGLDWTIRVNHADGPAPQPGPPAFALDPVPRCPRCGLPVHETPQGRSWLRSCASAACNRHELSRETLARTAALLTRAAHEAWTVSRPLQ